MNLLSMLPMLGFGQQQQQAPGGFMPDPRLLGREDLVRGDLDTQIYQPQAVPPAATNDPRMQIDPDDMQRQLQYLLLGFPRGV
jgi:hypothetical protein